MKFLVIGLGSMGKRRISLLRKHYPDIEIAGVDASLERRRQASALYSMKTYEDRKQAIPKEKPDAVLVCSPPESHGEIILDCIRNDLHIFSEINLLKQHYDEIIRLAKIKGLTLFLSSTLLYRKEIEMIKEQVRKKNLQKENGTVNYRYHVGQYLPDWHPWDKRKVFFPWNKRTSGCREIFAIELPWMIQAFGKIEKLTVIKGNITSMDIDYPDYYFVVMEHKNGNKGILMADVVCRHAVRELLVYSGELHITWNGSPDGLLQYNFGSKAMEAVETYLSVEKNQEYAASIIENAYLDELTAFLEMMRAGTASARYSFEEDKYTLEVIDWIERQ